MPTTAHRNLEELIEVADVTVRVASQLRLKSLGREIADRKSLTSALQFLEQATLGGDLLSGTPSVQARQLSSLRPLNWAADTYLRKSGATPSGQIDYATLTRYLNELADGLRELLGLQRSGQEAAELVELERFFTALGSLLSAQADRKLRERSLISQIDSGAGAH